MRDECDEPIYTYNDKYMRWFVRRSIKRGRVCSFSQYCKSKIGGDILKISSQELKVEGNVYDKIEAYMKYKNKRLKIFKEEYESKFDNYRDIIEEEMEKYINKKIVELHFHQFSQ